MSSTIMRPTNKLRWLELNMGEMRGDHPSAVRQSGLPFALVLQQWYEGVGVFEVDNPVRGKWCDIPIEQAEKGE